MFMFSKPGTWKSLSEQNKAIVKKLSKDKASDAFVEAINTGNHDLALFLFIEAPKTIRHDHLFICLERICQKKTGNAELLTRILAFTSLSYLNEFPPNSQRLLFAELAKSDFVDGWEALENWHLKRAIGNSWFLRQHFVDETTRVEIAASYDARSIITRALERNNNLLPNALTGALTQHPENTSLQWLIAKFAPTPQLLTKVLCNEGITNGGNKPMLDKIDILIAHGAQVINSALVTAFNFKDRSIFSHLLPHWKYNEDGEKLMRLEINNMDELGLIEQILAEKKRQIPSDNEQFTVPANDILVEILQLPDGGRLTKIFNFTERRQYTSMTTLGLPPSTPAMTDFEDISNPDIIRRAAEKLLQKGGDREVVEKALAYQRPLRIGKN